MIESEWEALQQALAGLDAEQMTQPGAGGWSVKDELAHLAAWARGLAALARKQPRYPPMGLPAGAAPHTAGIERMNEIIYANNRDLPLATVLEELHAAHEDALAAVSALSDEDLLRPYDSFQPQDNRPDGHTPILWRIAGNTFGHYAEHRETIMQMWDRK
jgi:uncharacterized protein (TIGR03083 family)